jgi:hypothetical protein
MPIIRAKLDPTLPPQCTDFLFEVNEDIDCENDSLSRFVENAKCAGAFTKMTPDEKHRHVSQLADEGQEYSERFAKRFETSTPADSKILAKSSSPSADEWKEAVRRSSRMTREGCTIKLFDAQNQLIAEREVTE